MEDRVKVCRTIRIKYKVEASNRDIELERNMKIYEYEMEYENGLLGHGNKRSLQFEENGSSFLFGTCETTL